MQGKEYWDIQLLPYRPTLTAGKSTVIIEIKSVNITHQHTVLSVVFHLGKSLKIFADIL